MPKVTVVIPVYNTERYIEQCARSLFGQSLDDIEFIFVDDCSEDGSIEILQTVLRDYPNRMPQVRILRQRRNEGPAKARLTGIKSAKGEYIICCDSDDWVESEMYERMYEQASQSDADIVVCNFTNNSVKAWNKAIAKVTPANFLIGILTKTVHCSMCNKLIRCSLYWNPISWPKENYAEDLALISQLSYYAEKIVCCPFAFYHYRFNPNSISKQRDTNACLRHLYQSCDNASLVERFFQDKIVSKDVLWAIDCMKSFERDRLIVLTEKIEYYRLWRKTFPELNGRLLINPLLPLKYKARYIAVILRLYPCYAKWRGLASNNYRS